MRLPAIAVLAASSAYGAKHGTSKGQALLAKLFSDKATSDYCAGCENAPDPVYTCPDGNCDENVCGAMPILEDSCEDNECTVQCGLQKGYYPDPTDCRKFCYCAGKDARDKGTGIRIPSKHAKCKKGTVWNKDCVRHADVTGRFASLPWYTSMKNSWYKKLDNNIGYEGGCCDYPRNILEFDETCPQGCSHLGYYHCQQSETCCWDAECNCCKLCPNGAPEGTTTSKFVTVTTATLPLTEPEPTSAPGKEPIEPVTSKDKFKYFPKNWVSTPHGGKINKALGQTYGLAYLTPELDQLGHEYDLSSSRIVAYIDGEYDELNKNFKDGTRAYKCKKDLRTGKKITPNADTGCGEPRLRGELFASWVKNDWGFVEIKRNVKKKKKKKK